MDTFMIVETRQYTYTYNLNITGTLRHVNDEEHKRILSLTMLKIIKYMLKTPGPNIEGVIYWQQGDTVTFVGDVIIIIKTS